MFFEQEGAFLAFSITTAQWILVLAMGLAAYRALRGPGFAVRILSLDLFSALVLGQILLLGLLSGRVLYFDVAIIIAVISFLATLAFARYLEFRWREKGGKR